MKLDQATDRYVEDMKADGRMGSANTEESYRYVLRRLAEDTGNAEVTNELKDAAADREKPPAGSDGEDRPANPEPETDT